MRSVVKHLAPLGGDRGDYVFAAVPESTDRVLDVGCAYGWGLAALTGKARELWGVDMDAAAIRQARLDYPHLHLVEQTATELPFDNSQFDVVILSDVIEYIPDTQKQLVIDEVHRVLKSQGVFVLTVPHQGLLAWLDPEDFKRQFPFFYQLYMKVSGYSPATPVEIGHRHLTWNEIDSLLRGRFEFKNVRYCGCFTGPLSWLIVLTSRLRLLPSRAVDAINRLRGWENGVRYHRAFAYNVWLTARKN